VRTSLKVSIPREVELTNTQLTEYGLWPHYKLPYPFQALWDHIVVADFRPHEAEAVVCFPGLLDPNIEEISWSRWQRDLGPFKHRFIAGMNNGQRVGQETMRRLATVHPDFATWQIEARHTPDQAIWAARLLYEVSSVALYAPRFHVTRALLTFVRALMDANWTGKVYPMGWSTGPGQLVLAGHSNTATEEQLIPGEQKRLVEYSEITAEKPIPDVASPLAWQQRYRP
jgi:hypothetical protein